VSAGTCKASVQVHPSGPVASLLRAVLVKSSPHPLSFPQPRAFPTGCGCSKEAAQQIIKLAAGNGFKKVLVGRDALMATPAMSALIRRRKLYGMWAGCDLRV
jgi:hypothetical protein